MILNALTVDRIIIHEIFKRDDANEVVTPTQGVEFTLLDTAALSTFVKRITDSVGDDSKAVEMCIKKQGAGDIPVLIDTLIDEDDSAFIVESYDIALKLAQAQNRSNSPGGIVVVFTGKVGANRTKFIGIFKADIHSGYQKNIDPTTKRISLTFAEELLLTPDSKLYKTAIFFQKSAPESGSGDLNDKWSVMVADTQIDRKAGKAAAQYFYDTFLGCGYLKSSARTTLAFHAETKKFLKELDLTEPEKSDLYNALHTYLKTDTSGTIGVNDFAEKYFTNSDLKDNYVAYMTAVGIQTTTFTRDLEHVESSLAHHTYSFKNKVKITVPAGDVGNLLELTEFDGESDDEGSAPRWTKIIIKDRISGQD
jgi:hypothetical protein